MRNFVTGDILGSGRFSTEKSKREIRERRDGEEEEREKEGKEKDFSRVQKGRS